MIQRLGLWRLAGRNCCRDLKVSMIELGRCQGENRFWDDRRVTLAYAEA